MDGSYIFHTWQLKKLTTISWKKVRIKTLKRGIFLIKRLIVSNSFSFIIFPCYIFYFFLSHLLQDCHDFFNKNSIIHATKVWLHYNAIDEEMSQPKLWFCLHVHQVSYKTTKPSLKFHLSWLKSQKFHIRVCILRTKSFRSERRWMMVLYN